jgi:hypothetical protein
MLKMNNKLLIVAITIIAMLAVFFNKASASGMTLENFGWAAGITSTSTKVAPQPSGQGYFDVPGQFQASIAPRFSNTGLPAQIRYSLPSVSEMACDPQTPFAAAAAVGCAGGGGNGNANIRENYKALAGSQNMLETSDLLPAATMENNMGEASANGGCNQNPVMFDRLTYAMAKPRGFQNSDYIRGDLAITPQLTGWFTTAASHKPDLELNAGALAVMGGAYNLEGRTVANQIMQSGAGAKTAYSGVEWALPRDTAIYQAEQAMGGGGGSTLQANKTSRGMYGSGAIQVSSFP